MKICILMMMAKFPSVNIFLIFREKASNDFIQICGVFGRVCEGEEEVGERGGGCEP